MTGEITLSGNVLPIGGVKEKVLAAKRAGVHDVILPAENKMNVEEDLTPEQLENVQVHYVKTIPEVLELALPHTAREEKLDEEEREKVLSAQGFVKPCFDFRSLLQHHASFQNRWETGIFITI